MHSTELPDPTPWLKGGEVLLTTGLQLDGPKAQREFLDRLAEPRHRGARLRHRLHATGALPAALVTAARKRGFPLFEVPYELPFIAITERAFARLLDERYELLQRNMVGDVLAEALSGHLYPEDLQARLRPFGIGERLAVLAFRLEDASAAAAAVERLLERRAGAATSSRSAAGCCARSSTRATARRGRSTPSRSRARIRAELLGALRRGARGRQPRRRRRTRCG